MSNLNRRHFLAGTLASGLAPLLANPLGMPIGFQAYPLEKQIAQDCPAALKQMAAAGYRTLELCSPHSYSGGFAALAKHSAKELSAIFHDAGLSCQSCHYQFKELKENLPERIEYAKQIGIKYMILSSFGKLDDSLDAWARAAADLNKVAANAKGSGIQIGFHNHHGEFKSINGTLIYDKLMSELDPKLVKMQFQVAVISAGFKAVDYFRKYPGRFASLHLADWSATEKKSVPLGKGAVDWPELFAAAKKAGVKNYFVEMNPDLMKDSVAYLHSLK